MLRASTCRKKKDVYHPKLTTRKQIADAKDKGDIRGWFAKLPRGRPKEGDKQIEKTSTTSTTPSTAHARTTASASTAGYTTKRAAPGTLVPQCDPKRMREQGTYNKWNSTDEIFDTLKTAVVNACAGPNIRSSEVVANVQVARSTVSWYQTKFELAAKSNGVSLPNVTREMVFSGVTASSTPLLSESDRKFLSDIAISRDLRNNGMTRSEMITTIMELAQCTSRTQAKNHFDYLVRAGYLDGLKRGGKVVTCQKTTTKRTQITMEQQLRWHTSVDFALSEQIRLNLPADEFEQVKEHFFCNMDESCLLGSDGTVRVIGASCKSKTEKIMSDCRASVTVLRTGAAGGSSGPWIFLAAGKELTCRALKNISKRDGVPPNSKVYMTPSAYMTDCVYADIAPELADGIRKMPFICEHPSWWVVVSLDGFGSHVNVHQAQEVFYKRKILILKEEGDTSHINQAYDQSVAKNDKAGMRANLDLIRPHIGTRLDQWYLITIAIEALKRVQPSAWIESFIKVNLHPRFRMSFDLWLRKIDGKLTPRKFFSNRTSLFDAMPAVWKKLSVEDRHNVVALIDGFYSSSEFEDVPIWTKGNVLQLVKYVPIGDVGKLRSSYLAAKIDPSVFVYDDDMLTVQSRKDEEVSLTVPNCPAVEEEQEYPQEQHQQSKIDLVCSWRPRDLLTKYTSSRHNAENQKAYFHHITNFVARAASSSDANLVPSAYLDVDVKADQIKLLKPTHKNVVMGFILKDTMGPGATKLIAKRRIDALDGNVGSYSRLLNSSARLEQIKEVNALAAAVAEITRDKEDDRKRKKEATAAQALRKANKKQTVECSEKTRRLEVMGYLIPLMEKFETGEENVSSLNALSGKVLKEILKYYYNIKLKGIASMKKVDLIREVAKYLVVRQPADLPAGAGAVTTGDEGH
ncbi:hypothetical protein MHU86_3619 [Fragilaria crotonensis]|nr:hypothetical protein MHU86_3619 [Fragilaria crotonensis]